MCLFLPSLKKSAKSNRNIFKYHHNKKPRYISMSLTCCELQIRESEITFLKEATYDQVCIYLLINRAPNNFLKLIFNMFSEKDLQYI